jgi:asparagine synthase (glutamine-hydrolysing)
MVKSLAHRGPDDSGIFRDDHVGLGHTRLSILDLTSTGHQPMQTEDHRYTLVYNGEIYNYQQLRVELLARGARFRGNSDSEVVLRAFASMGVDAFVKFNGMFALAIWDAQERRLVLARDRFGIKPYYYVSNHGALIFGSEIKALIAGGFSTTSPDWQALHEYLYYGNSLSPGTLFDGVKKLLPGHYLIATQGSQRDCAYWIPESVRPIHDSNAVAERTVLQRLEKAVADHLISDVPVGVFLSGGIDSSAITVLANRHYSGRLNTYSVAFDFSPEASELDKARRLANEVGTNHHELNISPRDIAGVIEGLVTAHDEPFADPADIPLFLMCRELKGELKVILQGDGGDEVFAGYRRYNVLAHSMFWRCAARALAPLNGWLGRGPSWQRTMRFLDVMRHPDPVMRTALHMTVEDLRTPPTRILSGAALAALESTDPFRRYRQAFERFGNLDPVQRMLYIDTQILLPDTFLEKVDKPTMAHSIEVRVPMLDANLTEYVMGLPSSMKVRRFQKKYILRRALRGTVPDYVLDAPKMGLYVPMASWLRGPLAEYLKSVLLDSESLRWGVLNPTVVEQCINEHLQSRRNNWFLLYKLLLLCLWRRKYLSGAAEGPRPADIHHGYQAAP